MNRRRRPPTPAGPLSDRGRWIMAPVLDLDPEPAEPRKMATRERWTLACVLAVLLVTPAGWWLVQAALALIGYALLVVLAAFLVGILCTMPNNRATIRFGGRKDRSK